MTDFRCPSCGFRIFNRRYPKCEGCGDALPASLLFSDAELFQLDAASAEHRRELEKVRARSGKAENNAVELSEDDEMVVIAIAASVASGTTGAT